MAVREAGDDTTTATVLAYAVLKEAQKVQADISSRDLKSGIEKATDKVVAYLEKNESNVAKRPKDMPNNGFVNK